MVYTHHSHRRCDDCGTKHVPNDKDACIETLKERIAQLEADLSEAVREVGAAYKGGMEDGYKERIDEERHAP